MRRTIATTLATTVCLAALCTAAGAETVRVTSPDRQVGITVTDANGGLSYTVDYKGQPVLSPSSMGLGIAGSSEYAGALNGLTYQSHTTVSGTDSYTLPVGKVKTVNQPYSEATLTYQSSVGKTFQVVARAYDDGVAFRYVIPAGQGLGAFTLGYEGTGFSFPKDYDCWGLNQGRLESGFEGEYDAIKASKLRSHQLFQTPFLCKTDNATFAIAESDVENYPGAFYAGRGDGRMGLSVNLAAHPDNDSNARASVFGAKLDASNGLQTPWRIVMIGDQAGDLIESTLVANLAAPSRLKDASWIKPGKAAWDWWNGFQAPVPAGVTPGANTATYKAYIDFAAEMGLEYSLIDEGWSVGSSTEPNPNADVTKARPEVDIEEVIRYAHSKGVKVWLWVQWHQLDQQMDAALATYQKWGVVGIKVDFMNRIDQDMVGFYHRLLSKAADHKLMVNLHGAYPPNGLNRTYPNYVTLEGILGGEYNKWSARITARHNVTMAYTRMLVGPMDYTPGGFRHQTPAEFTPRNTNPTVMTTRGQALAMYVIYDSPVQMVSDAPAAYKKADGSWEDGVDFLKVVPTTWDEVRFISGDIEDYIVLARRSGNDWYIGAMTNEEGRDVSVPLGFLSDGTHAAQVWQDGATLSTLNIGQQTVKKGEALKLKLAPNGGAVVRINPAQ